MFDDFNETLQDLLEAQASLEERKQLVRAQALNHVQQIISTFHIKSTELQFKDEVVRTSEPGDKKEAIAKYILPSGETWSGRGRMKNSFKEFIDKTKCSLEDLRIDKQEEINEKISSLKAMEEDKE